MLLENDTRTSIATLHTAGTGYWSTEAKAVRVTEIVVVSDIYEDDDDDYVTASMYVHFNTTDWSVDKDGLIYSDSLFVRELKDYLTSEGCDASGIEYSEQGMQGEDYVHFDVDKEFVDSWIAKDN
jgi:hypothetical protein